MVDQLVIPRPGTGTTPTQPPRIVPAPSEEAFTSAFGRLLPPAEFLATPLGNAAYYDFPPASPPTADTTPSRVLFVHGVQTPALGMLPLAGRLQKAFPQSHFVLLDLWGHGLSDTPVVPHGPELFHGLLDTLLDHLSWPAVHLVGFSFGGATTVSYVARRRQRVESFVLVAPAGLLSSSQFTGEQQEHLRGGDEVAAQKWVVEMLEGGELVVPADWKERVQGGEIVAAAVREWQMREHPGHTASVVAIFRDGGVMDGHEVFKTAAGLGVPSISVLGELDDLVNEAGLRDQGFTNIAVVPQVGHGVVRERVPEVAALITDFWKKLGTTAEQERSRTV